MLENSPKNEQNEPVSRFLIDPRAATHCINFSARKESPKKCKNETVSRSVIDLIAITYNYCINFSARKVTTECAKMNLY